MLPTQTTAQALASVIEVSEQRTVLGKRRGFVARVDHCDVGNGPTAKDAMNGAIAYLGERFKASERRIVVRPLNDGAVLVARWVSDKQMEYAFHRQGQQSGICMGSIPSECATLEVYIERVARDYDRACGFGLEVA